MKVRYFVERIACLVLEFTVSAIEYGESRAAEMAQGGNSEVNRISHQAEWTAKIIIFSNPNFNVTSMSCVWWSTLRDCIHFSK